MRDRYSVDGPWGVSVQVIPHRTAHSVSGTISLGLGMHGPCIGVNGGMNGENTGLLALPCLMQERQWNGIWLVCSNWSPEVTVDQKGQSISDSACLATALALVGSDHPNPLGHIRFEAAGQPCAWRSGSQSFDRPPNLTSVFSTTSSTMATPRLGTGALETD